MKRCSLQLTHCLQASLFNGILVGYPSVKFLVSSNTVNNTSRTPSISETLLSWVRFHIYVASASTSSSSSSANRNTAASPLLPPPKYLSSDFKVRHINIDAQKSSMCTDALFFYVLQDGRIYCLLLHRIAPKSPPNNQPQFEPLHLKLLVAAGVQAEQPPQQQMSALERAELVVGFAVNCLGCPAFITPQHIVDGNPRVNLIFLACLFHLCGKNCMDLVYREVISKREAFSRFINGELKGDADLDPPPPQQPPMQPDSFGAGVPLPPLSPPVHLLPLDSASVLRKCSDAVILWYVTICDFILSTLWAFLDLIFFLFSKLLNKFFPSVIDERVLNKKANNNKDVVDIIENWNLCINAAKALGANISHGITTQDMLESTNKDYKLQELIQSIIEVCVSINCRASQLYTGP